MTEDWTKWESLVINGAYPLRRFLARSDHSVVFLTEYTRNIAGDAAIKLIPADIASSEAQLAYWNGAVALAHPHLIRLFDAGRCQLGGHPFLFVVMEYAQQTLAQILPRRALTLDEVQELLPPTLDAMAFLHGKNLVHCRVKPPNFLVVKIGGNSHRGLSRSGCTGAFQSGARRRRPRRNPLNLAPRASLDSRHDQGHSSSNRRSRGQGHRRISRKSRPQQVFHARFERSRQKMAVHCGQPGLATVAAAVRVQSQWYVRTRCRGCRAEAVIRRGMLAP